MGLIRTVGHLLRKIKRKILDAQNNIKRAKSIGMLGAMKCMNNPQRIDYFVKVIKGEAFEQFKLKGGKKYKDKTFFVIRRSSGGVGLFSLFNTNAGYIKYAISKGYIPVVDMQNYLNCFIKAEELGAKNSWTYYFEQPMEYDLGDAYQGKNVIISGLDGLEDSPNDSMAYFNNIGNQRSDWKQYALRYMKIKNEIVEEARDNYHILTKGKRCLGVSLRGTDYVALKPANHPVQPTIEQAIEDAERLLVDWNCELIYLCTEDESIVKAFKNHFGARVVLNNRKMIRYSGGYVVDDLADQVDDRYNNGKQYLVSMLMLTMAECLLASRTSGTVAIEMFSGDWQNQYIYDLGRYPMKK